MADVAIQALTSAADPPNRADMQPFALATGYCEPTSVTNTAPVDGLLNGPALLTLTRSYDEGRVRDPTALATLSADGRDIPVPLPDFVCTLVEDTHREATAREPFRLDRTVDHCRAPLATRVTLVDPVAGALPVRTVVTSTD